MANSLSAIFPKILTMGLDALREEAAVLALVNTDYSEEAMSRGQTVDIPVSADITPRAVAPNVVPPASIDSTESTVQLSLDQWWEAPFHLTDKEKREIENGFVPRKITHAVKALVNKVASTVYANYVDFYGFAGTPGTTPFAADLSEATAVRKVLNNQLAPMSERALIIDPDAEANALLLRAVQDAGFSGSDGAIRDGQIGRKLGFNWAMDQLLPSHTNGTSDGAYLVNDPAAALALGDKVVPVDTGTGTLTKGEIITFAGHTQTYVITALYAGGAGNIAIEPGLQAVPANNAAITSKGAASGVYPQQLAVQRDAIGLAIRTLADEDGLGNLIMTAVDSKTGIPLRLEVSRQHKQTQFSFDLLWGTATIRRELGARIYG